MLMKSIIKMGAGEKGIVPAPVEEELVGGRSTLLLGNPELGKISENLLKQSLQCKSFVSFYFMFYDE